MTYIIKLTPEAISDIHKFKISGNKKALKKVDKLLDELRQHPTRGTGKPERLKHVRLHFTSHRI